MECAVAASLYERMAANLVESWSRYAAGAAGAVVHRLPGAAVAVFPELPERAVYNNTLLARQLDTTTALDVAVHTEALYADAGVTRFAVWAHEAESETRSVLERRGYTVDTSTLAMAMRLDDLPSQADSLEIELATWREYVATHAQFDLPEGLLAGGRPDDFHVLRVSLDGEVVATAIAFDHDGDCGIYNVGTVPSVRRRGIGKALTAQLLRDARTRGCTTASLQASAMAEGIYASIGFQDLGRYIEYVK